METRRIDRGRPPLSGPAALFGYAGYAGLVGGALAATWAAMASGVDPALGTAAVVIGVALLCTGLERVFPYTERWHPPLRIAGLDVLHSLVSALAYATMVWDHVFGTFFLPADRPPREELGVADAAIPEHYLWHLAAPFLLGRFERAAALSPGASGSGASRAPRGPSSRA